MQESTQTALKPCGKKTNYSSQPQTLTRNTGVEGSSLLHLESHLEVFKPELVALILHFVCVYVCVCVGGEGEAEETVAVNMLSTAAPLHWIMLGGILYIQFGAPVYDKCSGSD